MSFQRTKVLLKILLKEQKLVKIFFGKKIVPKNQQFNILSIFEDLKL